MESWEPEDVDAAMADHVFFGGLSAPEREEVIAFSRVETAGDGEILFQTGDSYRGFYLLLDGTVQIYRLNEAGRMLVLHVIRPNETFAEVPLFEPSGSPSPGGSGAMAESPDDRTYPATAEALEPSALLFVPGRAFLSFVDDHPRACLHMLGKMAQRLRGAVRQLDALSLQDVKGRLAQHLCREGSPPSSEAGRENGGENGGERVVDLDVPKSVLAAELGTVPETLSRAFGELEDEGMIRREGEQIALVDVGSLKRLGRA